MIPYAALIIATLSYLFPYPPILFLVGMGLGIDMGARNHGTVTPDMLDEEGDINS